MASSVAGKYELLDRIGAGGMATVHRARQRGVAGFDRIVAIKQISRELASKPEFTARFAREAQITSVLSHPSIIQIYDFGETTDGFFIAMEYIEGRSLREVVQTATGAGITIPPGIVLAIVRALCDALDHVHGRLGPDGRPLDLVHRDVTLANVVIARDGHLKLIDFGVASGRGFEPLRRAIVGKLSYIAPEVLRNQDGDSRVDVYAVGVIAWELLVGRPLFSGATTAATFRNVLHAEVCAPSRLRPELPVEIDSVVMAALARDPAQRPASAAELRDRIDRVDGLDSRACAVARWLAQPALAPLWTAPHASIEVATPATIADAATPTLPTSPASVQAAAALTPMPRFQVHSGRSRLRVAAVATALAAGGVLAIQIRDDAGGVRLATQISAPDGSLPIVAPALTAKPVATTVAPALTAKPVATTVAPTVTAKPVADTGAPTVTAKPVATPVAIARPTVATTVAPVAIARPTVATPVAPVAIARPTVATTTARPKRSLPRQTDTTPRVQEPHAIDSIQIPPFDVISVPPVPEPEKPSAPEVIRPDQVKRVSGAIPPLDHNRFAADHLSSLGLVSALVCIDEHGTVTSAKIVGAMPSWVRDTVVGGLRSFRFTPYVSRGAPRPACFARQLAVVDQ